MAGVVIDSVLSSLVCVFFCGFLSTTTKLYTAIESSAGGPLWITEGHCEVFGLLNCEATSAEAERAYRETVAPCDPDKHPDVEKFARNGAAVWYRRCVSAFATLGRAELG